MTSNIININNKDNTRYAFYYMSKNTGIHYSEELFEQWIEFDKDYWANLSRYNSQLPQKIHNKHAKDICTEAYRFQIFFKNYNPSFITALYMNSIYKNELNKPSAKANNKYKVLNLKNVI